MLVLATVTAIIFKLLSAIYQINVRRHSLNARVMFRLKSELSDIHLVRSRVWNIRLENSKFFNTEYIFIIDKQLKTYCVNFSLH